MVFDEIRTFDAVFYSQETWATTAGATIFVVAALTDWLDGYLARKVLLAEILATFRLQYVHSERQFSVGSYDCNEGK